jgi:hypothetical protein
MEANNYNDMSIPRLRALIADRGIPIGTARTKPELIALLQRNDTMPQYQTPPVGQYNIPRSPPKTPPQPTGTLPIPGAPRKQTVPNFPVSPTRPNVPPVPITPGLPQTGRVNIGPVSPTRPNVPPIPITPGLPQTGRVPIVPGLPQTGRVPAVPIVPTTGNPPVVPPTQIRPPVVPNIPPTQIKPPVVPNITPTQIRPPGAPILPPTQIRPPGAPILPPTQINPPITVQGPAALMRQKIQGATYDVYDFEWKRGIGYPVSYEFTNPTNFLNYFNRYQRIAVDGKTMFTMEYLMTQVDLKFIAELATALGFNRLATTVDMYYNLLWYLNIAQDPYANGLTTEEKQYISGLNEQELLAILGPKYRGPRDKASLIFAILSGKSAPRPDIADIPRYPTVAGYSPTTVWTLAKDMYGLIDEDNNIYSTYPPYVHVALQAPSAIERVVAAVTETNVDALMNQFQIVMPTQDVPQTPKEKVKYFIQEIAHYDPVFTRAPATPPPPVLTGLTKEQARNTLAPYTLKEIVEAYEPIGQWDKRKNLIETVRQEARGGSQWSWRHKWCNNDDTLNVFILEKHGDVDKDDPTDPTLSYGVQKNYRCYQAGELAANFREDKEDNIFHFRVPDWVSTNLKVGRVTPIDPTTGAPLVRDFPIESIRQLQRLLQNPPPGYDVTELARKVDEGLNAANNAVIFVRRLKNEYDNKPPEEQYLIRLYLAWLFIYGMWMRFWKGPGFRWPVEWVEGGGYQDRCETGRRDEHVFIQNSVRTAITEAYERYPGLKQWIEALPLLDYDFRTGEVQIATAGTTTIIGIIDKIQLGDFCMAHGSDLILKTAYYLIVSILNFRTGADFNRFIDEMMPNVLDIERQVVFYQLTQIKDRTSARGRALEARLAELGTPTNPRPVPKQPPFDPTLVGATGHTDPGLGWQIRFGENR